MNKKFFKKNSKNIWAGISVLAIFFFVSAFFIPTSRDFLKNVASKVSSLADVLSSVLVVETNEYRSINNESTLAESTLLTNAAQMKANDMAIKGYFSHVAPNGDKPWYWFKKIGYKYSYAGENLAVDFTESEDVTEGWINSAKHKANLLNTNFTEIGIGVAKGMFEGHETTFVVQFFGKPFNKVVSNVVTSSVKISSTTVESKKINENIIQLTASTSPTTAVVTRSDIPNGAVLGAETNADGENMDSQKVMFIFIGAFVLILVVLMLIFKKKGK
ncbi:MAG: CAP domain-containing protein [Candidatus Taylorbacteria bacterium]|nr:CAP domain-containing protein [Candidatus Taylorbacteria bacterium]